MKDLLCLLVNVFLILYCSSDLIRVMAFVALVIDVTPGPLVFTVYNYSLGVFSAFPIILFKGFKLYGETLLLVPIRSYYFVEVDPAF